MPGRVSTLSGQPELLGGIRPPQVHCNRSTLRDPCQGLYLYPLNQRTTFDEGSEGRVITAEAGAGFMSRRTVLMSGTFYWNWLNQLSTSGLGQATADRCVERMVTVRLVTY